MNAVTMTAVVGKNGVLEVKVPLGAEAAEKVVQVTIIDAPKRSMTQEEWSKRVDDLAGSWQGTFERPPQGAFEVRDAL